MSLPCCINQPTPAVEAEANRSGAIPALVGLVEGYRRYARGQWHQLCDKVHRHADKTRWGRVDGIAHPLSVIPYEEAP